MNRFDPYSGRRPAALLGASLAALLSLPLHAADVDGKRIANADQEPENWMSHGRDYGEQRYSPLKKVDAGNVDELGLAWSYKLDIDRGVEATPIVVDGVMYTTGPFSIVYALDARTGELIWK
jgi:quinohemoprotein ethanol dehydrogenase